VVKLNSKILVVVVVIIMVSATGGAFFLMQNKERDDPITERLTIFGNANLDDYLDQRDVGYLEGVVNGDNEKTMFSDTNGDGVVDQRDVDYLKSILNHTAPRIYYLNVNRKVASVAAYPEKIAANYWPSMDALMVIDAFDIVTHVNPGIVTSLNNGVYAPYTANDFGALSDGMRYDFESVVATGVDAIVCGTENYYFKGIEDLFTDETRIDMIRLPFWEGGNVPSAILTLAYLLGQEKYIERAHAYLDLIDEIDGVLKNGLNKVDKKATVLVLYLGRAVEARLSVEVECRGSGSYECSVIAGLDNMSSYLNEDGFLGNGMYFNTDQEYVIERNPDHILLLGSGGGFRGSETTMHNAYVVGSTYLVTTDAYKNDNIWVSGSGLMSGPMQMILALMIACNVYEDAFSNVNPYSYLQKYADNFTLINEGKSPSNVTYLDVDTSGGYLYMPKKA